MDQANSTFARGDEDYDASKTGGMSVDGSLIDQESPPPYVTFRKGVSQSQDQYFQQQFNILNSNMETLFKSWSSKQDEKLSLLLAEFGSVKDSIGYLSAKHDDLLSKNQELHNRVNAIELSDQSKDARLAYVESKLQAMEQRARSSNVEISNLPEKRGENLVSVIEEIAKIIKQPIKASDIISIHRVPQLNPRNSRPKNIVAKFSSQIIRDNFVAGVRLNKGISSDQLKLQGPSQKIYVNEHLTLENKKLFRQAREIAKEQGYKFVWIKHGVILARAEVQMAAIAIRSEKDLSKLKSEVVNS